MVYAVLAAILPFGLKRTAVTLPCVAASPAVGIYPQTPLPLAKSTSSLVSDGT